MQFSTRQHWFEHVGGIHRAFCCARTDQRMQFIDKEDNPAFRAGHFFEHCLQAFFEFTAILGACDKCTKIKSDYLLVFQGFGHISAHNALGQSLHNGGFPDARLANQDRVILGTAAEYLDDAPDLFVAPNHRVELALRREFREVAAIFFERLVFALRIRIGHPLRTANGGEGLQDVVTREPCRSQCTLHGSIANIEHGQQQVLHAQVLIMEGAHLAPGIFKHFAQTRRNAWLTATINVRQALEFVVNDALCCCEIATGLCNHLLHHTAFLGKQDRKQMLDLDLVMIVLSR